MMDRFSWLICDTANKLCCHWSEVEKCYNVKLCSYETALYLRQEIDRRNYSQMICDTNYMFNQKIESNRLYITSINLQIKFNIFEEEEKISAFYLCSDISDHFLQEINAQPSSVIAVIPVKKQKSKGNIFTYSSNDRIDIGHINKGHLERCTLFFCNGENTRLNIDDELSHVSVSFQLII